MGGWKCGEFAIEIDDEEASMFGNVDQAMIDVAGQGRTGRAGPP